MTDRASAQMIARIKQILANPAEPEGTPTRMSDSASAAEIALLRDQLKDAAECVNRAEVSLAAVTAERDQLQRWQEKVRDTSALLASHALELSTERSRAWLAGAEAMRKRIYDLGYQNLAKVVHVEPPAEYAAPSDAWAAAPETRIDIRPTTRIAAAIIEKMEPDHG